MAGGWSIGCPQNAGAAGTFYDAYVLSLRVDNDNITTETETPLLDFSTSPLWTNVYVENNAKVLVPLLWSRVQVCIFCFFFQDYLFFVFIGEDVDSNYQDLRLLTSRVNVVLAKSLVTSILLQANDCLSFG